MVLQPEPSEALRRLLPTRCKATLHTRQAIMCERPRRTPRRWMRTSRAACCPPSSAIERKHGCRRGALLRPRPIAARPSRSMLITSSYSSGAPPATWHSSRWTRQGRTMRRCSNSNRIVLWLKLSSSRPRPKVAGSVRAQAMVTAMRWRRRRTSSIHTRSLRWRVMPMLGRSRQRTARLRSSSTRTSTRRQERRSATRPKRSSSK
mmetsp:Transcript_47414/g.94610  ORF Transcript_47414/g.94610 Transcript_47414/m.94610 type:complete len:205 (+) Transcript_47414:166-780(+)